jgi:hypothetical protein
MYSFLIVFVLTFESCVAVNHIKETIPSLDGKYIVILFLRDAGATTDYSPQVSILKNGKKLKNKGGNIFRGYHSKYLKAYWENNLTLVIYHNCMDEYIFEKVEVFQDITIKYIVPREEDIAPEDINDFRYGERFKKRIEKENTNLY